MQSHQFMEIAVHPAAIRRGSSGSQAGVPLAGVRVRIEIMKISDTWNWMVREDWRGIKLGLDGAVAPLSLGNFPNMELATSRKAVVFVSTMGGEPWGGSEELWSRAALSLVSEAWPVAASVHRWSPPHERVVKLARAGVGVQLRPTHCPLWNRICTRIIPTYKTPIVMEAEKLFTATKPALAVLSDGSAFHPIDLLELCASKELPFVTISQSNHEDRWPNDEVASRYRNVLPMALRCYFVSNANRRLFEDQIGYELPNAELIYNPFNVDFHASPPWPPLSHDGELAFASVARLHPPSKGQDILLAALADPVWRERSWRLSVFGEGPMKNGIERMVQRLGLEHRVRLSGYATSIERIWAENHVLIMPSRYEGLPLVMVEAMLCARPVVATDVAGHAEVIEDGVTGFLADSPTPRSMSKALDRVWSRRMDLHAIGQAAARSIREHIPSDPVRTFVESIKKLVDVR
jgi:glycosyltransferase involved in cell wall biosynthesis